MSENKFEEILESSRSYPYSLNSFDFGVFRSVSGTKSLSKSRDDPRVVGALVGALGLLDFPEGRAPHGR